MAWLKRNWFTVLTTLIALVSGVDLTAGLVQGKSFANVTMLPSVAGAAGSLGTLFFRWFNNRSVTTRTIPTGLDASVQSVLEAIYTVAASEYVTPEMVTNLADIAAASVVSHANRVKTERLAGRVEVVTPDLTAFPAEFAAATAQIRESMKPSKKAGK